MNRLRLFAYSLALLWPSLAFGQGTVLQGGGFTGGHVPIYANPSGGQPIVTDGGGAAGGGPGVGLSELNITARGAGNPPYAGLGTGPLGTVNCTQDAPTSTGNYHYLCLSANAQGGGLLTFGAAGTAPIIPFNMVVNGVPATFPFGSGGGGGATVTPPLVPGNVPIETPTGIADSGVALLKTIPAMTVRGNNTAVTAAPTSVAVLTLGNGTAGAPIYSFNASPTTGMYSSGADIIDFAIAGQKALQIRQVAGTNFFEMIANSNPTLRAQGGTDSPIIIASNGIGDVALSSNAGGTNGFLGRFFPPSTGAAGDPQNYITFRNGLSGSGVTVSALGTADSNIPININPLGSGDLRSTAVLTTLSGLTIVAGSATQAFIKSSGTANFGVYYGTGNPGFSAAKGSLYTKIDATTTTDRLWVNTSGSTTWAFFTSNL